MILLNNATHFNIQKAQPSFKGKKLETLPELDEFRRNQKHLHLNEREQTVLQTVKELEMQYYLENGCHITMTKENIESMIDKSGGYPCDAEIIFYEMKACSEFDKLMGTSKEGEKLLKKKEDNPLKDYDAKRKAEKEKTLMAAQQNLINLTPAAIMK
ncbi:MAG: hypothetical protein WCK67_06380 [bacterium]